MPVVSLANKIMAECGSFRLMIEELFGGLKELGAVLRNVRFDDSSPCALKLPANVLAETFREVPLTDYTIFINPRFKEQLKTHNVAIENKRLRFVLAVTIIHEVCHLCLRCQGMMNTPQKLRGLFAPEAGEFFELGVFRGLITMRLTKDKKMNLNRGWNPKTMTVDAVLLKERTAKSYAILDSELERLWECVHSKHPFAKDVFPLTPAGPGRKVGHHALKRADGVHEGRRSCKYLQGEPPDFDDTQFHELDRCVYAPRKKLRH
jgi:hypothetical protein